MLAHLWIQEAISGPDLDMVRWVLDYSNASGNMGTVIATVAHRAYVHMLSYE